jgi:hypothetical protein
MRNARAYLPLDVRPKAPLWPQGADPKNPAMQGAMHRWKIRERALLEALYFDPFGHLPSAVCASCERFIEIYGPTAHAAFVAWGAAFKAVDDGPLIACPRELAWLDYCLQNRAFRILYGFEEPPAH